MKKPQRCSELAYNAPMRYSLQSLMIGMTLFCVLLGSRVEYLRRMAAYHKREVSRITDGTENINPMLRHHALAEAYSRAVYRPWTIVDESKVEP
jgi:hypothetical protein